MFTHCETLQKKTPQNGIGRKEYIQYLVDEFHMSTNIEAQEQITANLANFAYDPINYEFLRDSCSIELFLQLLTSPNERLVLHGSAGLTNICLDPTSCLNIRQPPNLELLTKTLQTTSNIEVALNLLLLFHFILSENADDLTLKQLTLGEKTKQRIYHYKNSTDNRIKTLAEVLIEDYFQDSENQC